MSPFQEVFDQGLGRYVGTRQVTATSVTSSFAFRDIKVHHFSPDDRGPACMRGDEFYVETREGPSDTLMIFLEGGGVCFSEVCAATAQPLLSLRLFTVSSAIGIGGLVDPRSDTNPARDFDVVNAPYCDGSLFLGDVDRNLSDGNNKNGKEDKAYQRGLVNITATFETAKRTFPNPSRVILVGSSGGAYGVVFGTILARFYYPNQPLLVVSDSGAPVVNSVDQQFMRRALTEFKADHLIPKSCPDCLARGHATGLLDWAMKRDPSITLAYMTHARDYVIGQFFMGTTGDEFQAAVVDESNFLRAAHPGRFFRFIIPGERHTLAMNVDTVPEFLQQTAVTLFGPFVLTGDSVSARELSNWTLGGLREKGLGDDGIEWAGYQWLQTLFSNPSLTPDVLQLK
ncbi:MAG TPA: pectin acetylesterase-family hydrolase [Labilithrix sp.]|nr:pectin acetylesterase-family hydrolase [Labilithrix sp.]